MNFKDSKVLEERILKEDPASLYPFFGIFTARCKYMNNRYENEVILVNSDTGKIYIGGTIYDITEITNCAVDHHGGYIETTYKDHTYIKTDTGSAIGRAVVGGVVAGGVGAVVGASTAIREIQTKKVASKSYVNDFYSLELEVNEKRVCGPGVLTNSKSEITKVVNFINKEKDDYWKKQMDKIEKVLFTSTANPIDIIKQIDNSHANSNYLIFSKRLVSAFKRYIGIEGLNYIHVDLYDISFSGKTNNIQDAKRTVMTLFQYFVSKYGEPIKKHGEPTEKTERCFADGEWEDGVKYSYSYYEKDGDNLYFAYIKKKKSSN